MIHVGVVDINIDNKSEASLAINFGRIGGVQLTVVFFLRSVGVTTWCGDLIIFSFWGFLWVNNISLVSFL